MPLQYRKFICMQLQSIRYAIESVLNPLLIGWSKFLNNTSVINFLIFYFKEYGNDSLSAIRELEKLLGHNFLWIYDEFANPLWCANLSTYCVVPENCASKEDDDEFPLADLRDHRFELCMLIEFYPRLFSFQFDDPPVRHSNSIEIHLWGEVKHSLRGWKYNNCWVLLCSWGFVCFCLLIVDFL